MPKENKLGGGSLTSRVAACVCLLGGGGLTSRVAAGVSWWWWRRVSVVGGGLTSRVTAMWLVAAA